MFRCLVLQLLDCLPFSASRIVLLLSWYIVIVGTYSPCATRKHLVHRTCAIALSMANNSASMELFVLSFCFVDAEYIAPFPRLITTPVLLLMSECTTYELSTHHFGSALGSIVRVRFFIFLMYCITFTNFL